MICRYPNPCPGLEPYILGNWKHELNVAGIYRYMVTNRRTKDESLYGFVFGRPGVDARSVWLNVCPICRVEFKSWVQSGRWSNGTIANKPP